MSDNPHPFELLERRRKALGMSRPVLARRSGVSEPTVARILNGKEPNAAFANVVAIAEALGVGFDSRMTDAHAFIKRQAEKKAKHIVALVQGTSGLEGQAVDRKTLQQMERRTVRELLTGSRRRLWSA